MYSLTGSNSKLRALGSASPLTLAVFVFVCSCSPPQEVMVGGSSNDPVQIDGTTPASRSESSSEFDYRASGDKNNLRITLRYQGNECVIVMTAGAFDKSKHKISLDSDGELIIDGMKAHGTEGHLLPSRELKSFVVTLNGESIEVPDGLWKDCYEPKFIDADSFPWTRASTVMIDPFGVSITMMGSDGGTGYTVHWYVASNREPSRLFDS